jgi:ribosomal protein S27AE
VEEAVMTSKPTNLTDPCPFCLSGQTEFLQADGDRWFVACGECGATGPIDSSPLRAHSPWAALSAVRRAGEKD